MDWLGGQPTIVQLPTEVAGRIPDYSYLQFQNGYFYALTEEGDLSTFAICGNSILLTDELKDLVASEHQIVAARFFNDWLYFNDNDPKKNGYETNVMGAIDLSTPAIPAVYGTISLPGDTFDFIQDEDFLWSFGLITVRSEPTLYSLGKVSLFTERIEEVDHLLLGTDGRQFSSASRSDDQVFHFDENLHRLFFPYTVSGFLNGIGWDTEYRLSVIDRVDQDLMEVVSEDFPVSVERSISYDSSNFVTFSDAFLYQFQKMGEEWERVPLLEARVPSSVFFVEVTNWAIVTTGKSEGYLLEVYRKDRLYSGDLSDRQLVPRGESHVCLAPEIFYTGNVVFVVQEQEGIFVTTEDCPDSFSPDQLRFIGFEVSSDGKLKELDPESLWEVYEIVQRPYCVQDLTNCDGTLVEERRVDDAEATCFSEEGYWNLAYQCSTR
ncbi:MAG: hypothetical protein HY538_00930 [Deltaproteobacteria bacterium]|nr:hypothetical protein [Deltaproteobacteria bacterium]